MPHELVVVIWCGDIVSRVSTSSPLVVLLCLCVRFQQVVSEVCQFVFLGPAGGNLTDLAEELKPYGRLLLHVVAEAQASSATVCSEVLDAVVSFAESESVEGAWPLALVLHWSHVAVMRCVGVGMGIGECMRVYVYVPLLSWLPVQVSSRC